MLYDPTALLHRLRRSITTRPTARDGLELILAAALLGVMFGSLGFATGLLRFESRPLGVILRLAPIVFVVPALGEEVVFRGLMIPDRTERPSALAAILVSTAIFTGWHVVETQWLKAEAATFLRPDFLAWAAGLGLVCAVLRRRSGSIWPPVILHWAAVVAWMGWFGGRPLI
jgi:predicted Abi (CAAX) family protease